MTSVFTLRSFWLPVGTLCWRELVRFYRQKGRLVGALGTPLVFWVFIGSGFGRSFQMPDGPQVPSTAIENIDYLEYFFPGTVILIVLFTSIFSTISVIEDRREGFLLSVLVAPVSRSVLVLGKVLGGATLAFLQGLLFVLLAPLLGLTFTVPQLLLLAGILFLISLALTGLGFSIAWQSESTQGFHSIMNIVLIPMWMLSGALFPVTGAASWVQWVMKINPLTYGMAALRHTLYFQDEAATGALPSLTRALTVTVIFMLLTLLTSWGVARRKTVRGHP